MVRSVISQAHPDTTQAESPQWLDQQSTVYDDFSHFMLRSKDIALGTLAGIHRSKRSGSSIEFQEHRRYTPGDDIRRLDWKALGKTDRLHVKTFEDECNLSLYLVLDCSSSMDYASDSVTKFQKAKLMAAALAYIAFKQRDAVGLLQFSDSITDFKPAANSARSFENVISNIANAKAVGKSDFNTLFKQLINKIPSHHLIIILSDFLQARVDFSNYLHVLASKGLDVSLFHILDPYEVHFPFTEPARFKDSESNNSIFLQPHSVRSAYCNEIQAHMTNIAQASAQACMHYYSLLDRQGPQASLSNYISSRHLLYK